VSADEYGFRPLPPEGLTIWEKVGILAGLLVIALAGLTIALNCQLNAAADRYNKLWVGDWRWPEHYHLLAENEDGERWEIWFEAPNRWLVREPTGMQVSDGGTVTAYVADGNFYTQNPVNKTYLDLGIGPLGARDPEELKRVLRSAEDVGSAWSVKQGTYLGLDVDVVQMGRSTGGNQGIVRTLVVDPRHMVLLREALADLNGHETYLEATSVDYDVRAPDGTFVFEPPPGSCLKATSTGPCLP
jgi:outer membrane lipoprotein-sorting protein